MRLASTALVGLLACGAGGCFMQGATLHYAYKHTYDPESGRYPELGDIIFGKKAMRTALWKPERFTEFIGFAIFLTGPHDPSKLPVLLVHGHGSGPRSWETLSEDLDPRLEPWFAFYATGDDIDITAALMRESLVETCKEFDVDRVAIVGYSQGGLVTRKGLSPAGDGLVLPEVPVYLGLSVPWGGSEIADMGAERDVGLPSYLDLAGISPFIATLLDAPIPPETRFHMIYGLGAEVDEETPPGDGVVSEASLSRPEAAAQAEAVHVFEDALHSDIITEPGPRDLIEDLLLGATQ